MRHTAQRRARKDDDEELEKEELLQQHQQQAISLELMKEGLAKSEAMHEGRDACLACSCVCIWSVALFFVILYFDLPV